MDEWLREAKADEKASQCGMFLFHNGVVRESAKAQVRSGVTGTPAVTGMYFSYDAAKVDEAIACALAMPGSRRDQESLCSGRRNLLTELMVVKW